MSHYECRGCGETNNVVAVSLVPRTQYIFPGDEWGSDEAYWEGETVIGFGCMNDECRFAQVNVGAPIPTRRGWSVRRGPTLKQVAKEVPD
jgi:hypothetical protein